MKKEYDTLISRLMGLSTTNSGANPITVNQRPVTMDRRTSVASQRSVVIEWTLDRTLIGGQVLLFELDTNSGPTLYLLSGYQLMQGSVRFAEKMQVPRQTARRPGNKPGVLRFTQPGNSLLIAVVVKNPTIRLDHLPFFLADKDYIGPRTNISLPTVNISDMNEFLDKVEALPSESWKIAIGSITRLEAVA